MNPTLIKKIGRHTLWISILLHFLLLTSFSVVLVMQPKKEDDIQRPALDIPAYVAEDPITPVETKTAAKPQQQIVKENEKRVTEKTIIPEKSAFANSPEIKNVTRALAHSISKTTEQVHLIGDKNIDRPLITLLGKALAHHLVYPRVAVDFNVKGIVLIGFTLYPDGHLTGVEVVKPSNAQVLDKAALDAVTAMSPVSNVSKYLQEPKYLVVGIIFA